MARKSTPKPPDDRAENPPAEAQKAASAAAGTEAPDLAAAPHTEGPENSDDTGERALAGGQQADREHGEPAAAGPEGSAATDTGSDAMVATGGEAAALTSPQVAVASPMFPAMTDVAFLGSDFGRDPASDADAPGSDRLMIRVTGPIRGRRRAGRQFGPDPVLIALDELTEAEIEALRDDPALRIEVVT